DSPSWRAAPPFCRAEPGRQPDGGCSRRSSPSTQRTSTWPCVLSAFRATPRRFSGRGCPSRASSPGSPGPAPADELETVACHLGEDPLKFALQRGGHDLVQERRVLEPARDHLEEAADQQALR